MKNKQKCKRQVDYDVGGVWNDNKNSKHKTINQPVCWPQSKSFFEAGPEALGCARLWSPSSPSGLMATVYSSSLPWPCCSRQSQNTFAGQTRKTMKWDYCKNVLSQLGFNCTYPLLKESFPEEVWASRLGSQVWIPGLQFGLLCFLWTDDFVLHFLFKEHTTYGWRGPIQMTWSLI